MSLFTGLDHWTGLYWTDPNLTTKLIFKHSKNGFWISNNYIELNVSAFLLTGALTELELIQMGVKKKHNQDNKMLQTD